MSLFDISSFFPSLASLPLWKLLVDCVCAVIMWALLARFVVVVLFGDSPPTTFLKFVLTLTNRLMRAFRLLTPRVFAPAAHSLYAAFFVFLLRYYGLPAMNNYSVSGLASLPAEAQLAKGVSFLLGLV